ncbi:serine hydrolase [Sphingobium sp. MK2]|uniref:serine hydrolase domain-containing protein n=1 Tax=Sphingobium sp. MK2 TaxID=3116540 RepID=UPI0032E36640
MMQAVTASRVLTTNLQDHLGDWIRRGDIAGGIILVSQGDDIIAHVAMGADGSADDVQLQPDSCFCVASLTKVVTAAAACQLIAQGKLDPYAPLSHYIPQFATLPQVRRLKRGASYPPLHLAPGDPPGGMPEFDVTPARRTIAVRDIMNFTSGLHSIGLPNPSLPLTAPDDSIASYVAKLPEAHLDFDPGSRWAYSSATGYEVLARLVEIAADMPFADYCAELLFEPLDMKDSCFGLQPRIASKLADRKALASPRTVRTDYASGSAGLFTTAADYARFGRMLLGQGMFEGRKILLPAAVDLMRTNQIGDLIFPGLDMADFWLGSSYSQPGLRYGYGVLIVEDCAAAGIAVPSGSYGWDGIGTRRLWVMPALDAVLVILMPGAGHGVAPLHRAIERIVVDALSG